MSYKIYSYPNPYLLDDTEIWQELINLPHFCSSSVMAQSLWGMYHKKGFKSFFWAMNDIVDVVYKDWQENIERQVAQYINVSSQIRTWRQIDALNQNRNELFDSIEHNKDQLIESLRLFTELGIDERSLHNSQATPQQKVFIALYNLICSGTGEMANVFAMTDEALAHGLNVPMLQLIENSTKQEQDAIQEINKRYENSPEQKQSLIQDRLERIERLNSLKSDYTNAPISKIVVHGIHQFKPLQLRLISKLSDMGVEVIFLFNYIPERQHIYATWHHLYGLLDTPICQLTIPNNSSRYKDYRKYPLSYQLSEAFSNLIEAQPQVNGENRRKWLQISQQVETIQFQNTSEMATYISGYIDSVLDSQKPLSTIKEKVYSASKESDELLKIYYPQFSGGRHFLHYPIGQFFMAIYRLWDESQLEIKIDYTLLRECAAAGIASSIPAQQMLEVIKNAEALLLDLTTYAEALERLQKYIETYNSLLKGANKQSQLSKYLSHVSFYNSNTVSLENANALLAFIKKLQAIALQLFTENGQPIRKFTDHFKRLDMFMRKNITYLVEGEEKEIVNELLERFNTQVLKSNLSGTIDDLRAGLYYYLRQKEIESPDWIVRNFVQIEGDVLRSKGQSEGDDVPTYHFACLSDRLLTQKTDDLLPWPLDEYFIHSVYSPNALVFQMYYVALSEFQSFARYALFYGLHFNCCPVRLSYVKHITDKEENFYHALSMLGLKPTPYASNINYVPEDISATVGKLASSFIPTKHATADFLLCPLKYYFDFCVNDNIVFRSKFAINRFYVNLLIDAVWHRWEKAHPSTDEISNTIIEQQKILDEFFPFLRGVNDKADLRNAAFNYITGQLMASGRPLPQYDAEHMVVKMLFQTGYYDSSVTLHHPYQVFDALTEEKEGKRLYKLYTAMKQSNKTEIRNQIKEYLVSESELKPNIGKWCANCPGRDACPEICFQDKTSWED